MEFGSEQFGIVLVQVGRNDILSFTDLEELRDTMRKVMKRAGELAAMLPGNPGRYDSPDCVHPGSEGYRVWYEELKKQTGPVGLLKDKQAQAGRENGPPAIRERETARDGG